MSDAPTEPALPMGRWAHRAHTLPIRTKLGLLSALVVLALVALPALSLYRDVEIRNMDDTRFEIQSLHNMVLALERSQNDFINTFEPEYRDDFSLTFEEFVLNTEELKVRFWDLDLPIDTLERLVVLTSEYQYLFEVLAVTQTEIGQDDTQGLRNQLHASLDRLQEAMAPLPEFVGTRYLMEYRAAMLRLPAQGLLANRQQSEIITFEARSEVLERLIRARIQAPAIRKEALDALSDARATFEQLSAALVKIGLDHNSGLLGEIDRTVDATKEVVNNLNSQVNDAIDRRERFLNIMMGVMAATFSLVFISATALLARSISRPIRGVTEAMTRLADGDLSVDIPGDSRRDEIGDMFRALRVFKMGAIIRRRTQEELRKAHAQLEERVEERTAELSAEVTERRRIQNDLMAAREEAEAANHAKSVFLANMSHELRTPLNAIIGYAEMLKEDAQDSGDKRLSADLDKIHGAGKHLLGVINEILDLSKIEAGRLELDVETFGVRDVLDTVAGTVKHLVQANGNEFEVHAGEKLGLMESDMMRLRQILYNFLSNAAKFTHEGTVTLSCDRVAGNNGEADTLVFTIGDTGIGMDEDQLKQIFKPFTQADASTSRKYGGTGLGLTVNREFARLLGGEIEVESEPGVGTTFTVRVPAVAPPQQLDANTQQTTT